jgi:hypothetical protein
MECYVTMQLEVMFLLTVYMTNRSFPFGRCLCIFTSSVVPLTSVRVGVACSTVEGDGGGFV